MLLLVNKIVEICVGPESFKAVPPRTVTCLFQDGTGTEPEPETGTVGTISPGTESRTGTVGTVFQEPKPEACLLLKTAQKHRERPFLVDEEPSEPKTGTARTAPCANRKRTEPSRDHPVFS